MVYLAIGKSAPFECYEYSGCHVMRRWVILFLLLVNVIFFFWLYQEHQQKPKAEEVLMVPDGVASLTLLSEADGQSALKAPAKRQAYLPEDELSSEALIRRFKSGQLDGVSPSPEASTAKLEQAKAKTEGCLKVGPFVEKLSGKQVAYRLKEAGVPFVELKEAMAQPSLWWVYLPPFDSKDQALRVLRRLQGNKVDSFLVTSGEFTHAISLGYFSKQETANNVLEESRKQGYSAKILEKPRSDMVSWFVVNPDAADNWLQLEQSLLAASPDLKKIKKSCKSIALKE